MSKYFRNWVLQTLVPSLAILLVFAACEKKEIVKEEGPSHYEHLKGLDWLVGKWVDKEEDSIIEMEGKWDKNKNFLTQKFTLSDRDRVELEGFQIIGWDPVNKIIRSWVFDSDGGFGEGVWRMGDGVWIVEAEQTLPNGQKGSAINVYSNIQKDTYTWESTGREVAGTILPNLTPVTVKRKGASL